MLKLNHPDQQINRTQQKKELLVLAAARERI